tara:strand:- start:2244 stop:3182 length:939 start_codon:yes stop_codon:yes gene_type:complete
MAQEDYIIADQAGVAFRQDLNATLAAIVSNNSGATEPAVMYAYQWWADTTSGLLKQRNAANNAWVSKGLLSSAFDPTLEIGATKTSRKNLLINGNFPINQEAVSGTVTLGAGVYGHDMFKGGASGCTYTFATSANVTTLTISAGSLIQVVEGLSLFTGTYVLSFDGTAQGKIGAGSFADSGVTGSITGGTNTNIEFNAGTLSKVQLEKSSIKTNFEELSIGDTFLLCERYFKILFPVVASETISTNGALFVTSISFTRMRAAPTVTETFFSGAGVVSVSFTSISISGLVWNITNNTAGGWFRSSKLTLNARL